MIGLTATVMYIGGLQMIGLDMMHAPYLVRTTKNYVDYNLMGVYQYQW